MKSSTGTQQIIQTANIMLQNQRLSTKNNEEIL